MRLYIKSNEGKICLPKPNDSTMIKRLRIPRWIRLDNTGGRVTSSLLRYVISSLKWRFMAAVILMTQHSDHDKLKQDRTGRAGDGLRGCWSFWSISVTIYAGGCLCGRSSASLSFLWLESSRSCCQHMDVYALTATEAGSCAPCREWWGVARFCPHSKYILDINDF